MIASISSPTPPPLDLTESQLADLVERFQTASQSLERSYGELQVRVQSLTAELERERGERIRLERLAAMGEMALELAHEIRNPLGSIELYASMMSGEYAQQIVRSVKVLDHTLSNVLQFARSPQPVMECVPLKALLDDVRAFLVPMAAQKQIRIDSDAPAALTIDADPALLRRLVMNLALNALRETRWGGSVRLLAGQSLRSIWLSVEDDGPGIPDAVREQIFDPLFSTSRQGCGLGLPIVKRIVDAHDGTIELQTSSSGTRFIITLPSREHGKTDLPAGPAVRAVGAS